MTVVLGFHSYGAATLVADQMESFDDDCQFLLNLPKIAKTKNYLIGAAGDSVLCNIVVHHTRMPTWTKSDTDVSYFTKKLPAAWMAEFKAQNIPNHEDVEIILVSPEHGIWLGTGQGGVARPHHGFWAIGSGAKFALGAYAAGCTNFDELMRITSGLCPTVSSTHDILTL